MRTPSRLGLLRSLSLGAVVAAGLTGCGGGTGPCSDTCGDGMVCDSATLQCVVVDGGVGGGSGAGGGSGGGAGGGSAGGGSGGAGGGTAACTADTFQAWPTQFFQYDCSNCHGSEFSSQSYVQSRRQAIASRISSGNMPQGFGLSAGDRNRILTWLNCGAP